MRHHLLSWSLALALLVPSAAASAAEYVFTIRSEGEYPSELTGRLIMEGQRWRLDVHQAPEVVSAWTSVFCDGASEQRVALNATNGTWFALSADARLVLPHSLLDFYRVHPTQRGKIRSETSSPENSVGPKVLRWRFAALSKISAQPIRSDVTVELTLSRGEPAVDAAAFRLLAELRTGVAEIDAQVKARLKAITGAFHDMKVVISRRLEGGKVMRQSIHIVLEPAKNPVEHGQEVFRVPPSYKHQKPQFGAPG